MIKKIHLLTFIFCAFITNNVHSYEYDCLFEKIKPGVNKKSLEEINIFAYGLASKEGFLSIPINAEQICKGDPKDINGLVLELMFLKDKLIKVNYINNIPESLILFEIAKKDYKINFSRNKQQVEKKQSEFYKSSQENVSYFYVLLKDKDKYGERHKEFLEIVSNVAEDKEKIDEFFLNLEEKR